MFETKREKKKCGTATFTPDRINYAHYILKKFNQSVLKIPLSSLSGVNELNNLRCATIGTISEWAIKFFVKFWLWGKCHFFFFLPRRIYYSVTRAFEHAIQKTNEIESVKMSMISINIYYFQIFAFLCWHFKRKCIFWRILWFAYNSFLT